MDKNEINASKVVLREFLKDISCLDELLPWTEKFNLFDVLKISRAEIRHSNMLGWLLDPSENHGLGDAFLKGILQCLIERDTEDKYDVFKILLMDLYGFTVTREWRNIDILLVSGDEKIVIAVENKVGTSEHDDQLNRYRKILEEEYLDYHKVLIYLTPDGEEPSDPENWTVLTYGDVWNVLNGILENTQLSSDVELMIRNYVDILRRDIVEDRELTEICDKIYRKHQKALDLIYEHRTNWKNRVEQIIRETLKDMAKDGNLIYKEGWNINFRTEILDKLLPEESDKITSWGACYWIEVHEKDKRICGYLALYKSKIISETSVQNMQKIIAKLRPNDKREEFGRKIVLATDGYELPELDADDWDNIVRLQVTEAVNCLLKKEKETLKDY
jgi:hypothetical protein